MSDRAVGLNRLQYVGALERKAGRDMIVAEGWRLQALLGRSSLDFSKCNTVAETNWVRLGGNVATLRLMQFGTLDESVTVLTELRAAAGVTAPAVDGLTALAAAKRDAENPSGIEHSLASLGLDPDLAKAKDEHEARTIIEAKRGRDKANATARK